MNSLNELENFKSISDLYETVKKEKTVNLTNVKGGLQGFIALTLYEQTRQNDADLLMIMATDAEAKEKADLLAGYIENVYYFPPEHLHDYFSDAFSLTDIKDRQKVLTELLKPGPSLIVSSLEALLKRLPSPKKFASYIKEIKKGEEFGYSKLIDLLSTYGYERVYQTEATGQFSVRGEVVDVFLSTEDRPVRFDFFDDEIETIYYYDPETQRSEEEIDEIRISPLSENWQEEKDREKNLKKVQNIYGKQSKYEERLALLEENANLPNGILFAFSNEKASLFDYLNYDGRENSVVLFVEPERAKECAKDYLRRADEDYKEMYDSGQAFKEERSRYFSLRQIENRIKQHPLVNLFLFEATNKRSLTINMDSRTIESFADQIDILKKFLQNRIDRNYYIHFFANDEAGLEKLQNYVRGLGLGPYIKEEGDEPGIRLSLGNLIEGFELAQDDIVFLSENDVFHPKKKRKRYKSKNTKSLDRFTDLKVGDYVVHDENGIGEYMGIKQMEIDGVTKDMMHIKYAGDDSLYIPVDQMDMIQVYIGTGEAKPKLNTLGSPAWSKAKSRAKKSADDMADELIALYAKRENNPGYAFSPDTVWQKDFEEAFEFEETDDQLQSIKEIKEDMEKPVAMDRLLCGDVGYGKTEVAFRAAFKAVMDNKQVAILVPTTVLAQQHYSKALKRFKNFPINIEVLNRFKTKKEQKEILENLKTGKTDIIIGTHRLLSKDVKFDDLGLLIVDEEQRFGVRSKEKLKQLKENVDVLTLSATPIPRTLHMSLSGVRDMSVLEEPPVGRRPIKTYVMNYSAPVIRDAINRELERKGQIYYVHNRVHDIDEVTARLKELVPEARIVQAHGQMSGKQLEDIMERFLNKEYDILVSTTIIENGLDVQNANTMIVEDGNHFGLSQLYQLRGRVGRSPRQAYTYITHKRQSLNEDAAKRLKAIRDFTAFGSGFKIAMRDLEIRGAGNLLGSEQSGHMAKIGYELYTRILKLAVDEKLSGKKIEPPKEAKIKLTTSAYIPGGYIEGEDVKYEVYRKLISLKTRDEYDALEDELIDRFGSIPQSVYNLMLTAMIKNLGLDLGIISTTQENDAVKFVFESVEKAYEATQAVLGEEDLKTNLKINNDSGVPNWTYKVKSKGYRMLVTIYNLLERIHKIQKEKGEDS